MKKSKKINKAAEALSIQKNNSVPQKRDANPSMGNNCQAQVNIPRNFMKNLQQIN